MLDSRVSWYYTATTVTSIGYGDITPQNADERLVASTVMIFSQLYFAKALGRLSGFGGFKAGQNRGEIDGCSMK